MRRYGAFQGPYGLIRLLVLRHDHFSYRFAVLLIQGPRSGFHINVPGYQGVSYTKELIYGSGTFTMNARLYSYVHGRLS